MLEIQDNVIVGTKQVLRALEKQEIETVYLANDADAYILQQLTEALRGKHCEIIRVETMKELGIACKISVNAAVAAIPKP